MSAPVSPAVPTTPTNDRASDLVFPENGMGEFEGEAELLELARAGDENAFRVLYG